MEEKRRKYALEYYYVKQYGDQAVEKMQQNKAKKELKVKEGKVYKKPPGRPSKTTPNNKNNLMYYYRKKYGEHADQIYQLQVFKKQLKKNAKNKDSINETSESIPIDQVIG